MCWVSEMLWRGTGTVPALQGLMIVGGRRSRLEGSPLGVDVEVKERNGFWKRA